MASGLAADDTYNLYDKPLFAERGSNLYRPNKAADEVCSPDPSCACTNVTSPQQGLLPQSLHRFC